MTLTNLKITKCNARDKQYKIYDEKGLYLLIKPNGQKYWRFRFKYGGKEKILALGVYDEVSLKDARLKRDEARMMLSQGINPMQERKEAKLRISNKSFTSFLDVAKEWHEVRNAKLTLRYRNYVWTRLKCDVLPHLGDFPIVDIRPEHVIAVLKKIEARGAFDLAKRQLQKINDIFKFAIVNSWVQTNICTDLSGALTPVKTKGYNFLQPNKEEFGKFLNELENYNGKPITILAFKFLIITFLRTSEVITIEWCDIDFEKKELRIPAEKMKMDSSHVVPLSKQALMILEQVKAITTEAFIGDYVFPSPANSKKHLSNNTFLGVIKRMKWNDRTTGHGFRKTASTALNESQLFNTDAIERQLSHCETNGVRAAYNFAQHLQERHKIMQWWSDYVENIAN